MTSHLESTASHFAERQRQLKLAFELMTKCPPDQTVIFGGDLNLRDKEVWNNLFYRLSWCCYIIYVTNYHADLLVFGRSLVHCNPLVDTHVPTRNGGSGIGLAKGPIIAYWLVSCKLVIAMLLDTSFRFQSTLCRPNMWLECLLCCFNYLSSTAHVGRAPRKVEK